MTIQLVGVYETNKRQLLISKAMVKQFASTTEQVLEWKTLEGENGSEYENPGVK